VKSVEIRKTLAIPIMGLLLAFAAISLAALFFINVRSFEEAIEDREADRVLGIRFMIGQILEEETRNLLALGRLLAANRSLQEALEHYLETGDSSPVVEVMEGLGPVEEGVVFSVADASGRAVLRPGSPWGIYEALGGAETAAASRGPDGWTIDAIAPLTSGGRVLGAVSASRRIDHELARRIASETGTQVSFCTMDEVLATSLPLGQRRHIDFGLVARCLKDDAAPIFAHDHDAMRSAVYAPVKVVDETFALVVQSDSAGAYALAAGKRREMAQYFVLVTAVFLVLGSVLALHIIRPLRRLRDRAAAVVMKYSGKELSPGAGGDEVEDSAHAFDIVLETMERHIAGRRLAEEELRRHQENLEELVWERTAELRSAKELLEREVDEHIEAARKRAELEEQLRHSQKMEAVGRLAGGVAHEFNNRLAAITHCAYLLRTRLDEDDPMRACAEQILASSEKAAGLTRGLLALGRRQVVNLRPLDLNDVVRSVSKLLAGVIGRDIRLDAEMSASPLTVMADEGQMEQVVLNLATNARDAMPEGGGITIRTGLAPLTDASAQAAGGGAMALLTFSDTGTGIPEEVQGRIFEPFFTTKPAGRGTGLGLSIIYGIIKQHGGHIRAESAPGKGTTFKIYLPLAEKGAARSEAPAASQEGGGETLLLAEDDPEVREFTRRVLEEFGYRVLSAADGDEAVRLFRENKESVGLVLADAGMPGKSGAEVLEAVKSERPDVEVIFMSAYARSEMVGPLGEAAFIPKPVRPEELLRKIRVTLDRAGAAKG